MFAIKNGDIKPISYITKLLGLYFALQLILGLAFVLIAASQNRRLSESRLDHELFTAANGLLPSVRDCVEKPLDISELSRIIHGFADQTSIRVTVIDSKGVVLVDSSRDAAQMENHLTRSEFRDASTGALGKAMRMSETTKLEHQYLAVAIRPSASTAGGRSPTNEKGSNEEGRIIGYLRVSIPTAPFRAQLWGLTRTASLLAVVSALVVTFTMFLFANSLTAPLRELLTVAKGIAKGNYDQRMSTSASHSDWAPLAEGMEQMQKVLREREAELVEQRDRLESVLMSMNEGVISYDTQRHVLLSNRAAVELLGADDIAFKENHENPYLPHATVQRCVEDAFVKHEAVSREWETAEPDKKILSLRATWLSRHCGESVVVVIHDVTGLRHLETMRRDFVANASHELKTPLASIKAYAETLRLGAIHDQGNRMRFVERIEQQADRLHHIIMDLLELTRIESGQTIFEIVDVELTTVATDRAATFKDEAEKKGILLKVEHAVPSVLVRAETQGVATILDNLISNAIRYTPTGGSVTIQVSIEKTMGCLVVIDNGPGIAPEHHERIFERFYRVDKARSADVGGTGLGLSIVKHLAQSLGGTVGLTSELGKGSRFVIKLPMA